MSSQGSGSVNTLGFERQLLEDWGGWARGDIGLWYTAPGIWVKNGIGSAFTEDDLMAADAAVARLPSAHKSVLKLVYIKRRGLGIDRHRIYDAIAAFSESLSSTGEEKRSRAAVNRDG